MSQQSRTIDESRPIVFVLWRLLGLATVWALVPALVGDNRWQLYGAEAFCTGTALLALVACVLFVVRERRSQPRSKDFKALCAIVGTFVAFIAIFGPYFVAQRRVRSRVIDEVRGLVEPCKQLGDTGRVTVRGKALVWYMSNDSESVVNDMLPSDLKAGWSDQKITVFMIVNTRDVEVGTYSVSHQAAMQQVYDVAIAYWPEKEAAGMVTVTGGAPPSTRPVRQESEMGPGPFKEIADWIAALPRS
jgi:hypothetical protein